jgi:hypothetical protein
MGRRFHRGRGPRRIGSRSFVSPVVVEAYELDEEPEEYFISRRELDEAGDIFPTFVTAEDAKRYIGEIDTGHDRLNVAILASTTAPPEFKASWTLQLGGWKTFATGARASVGFLNAKAVMEQTDRWATQLTEWRTAFSKIGGTVPGPAPTPPGQGVPGSSPAALGDLTMLIVAAGVVAAIVIFGPRLAKE